MKPKHRFHIQPTDSSSERIQLDDNEAHHAIHVLRVRSGDQIELFDGQGNLYQAEIATLSKKNVEAKISAHTHTDAQTPTLTLTQAWLNHEKNHEIIIRRATELGVSEIRFIKTKNSERKPKEYPKWQRWAVESCKQCKRLWLPKIQIVEPNEGTMNDSLNLLATQHAAPKPLSVIDASSGNINIQIGPEGDFSKEEVKSFLDSGAVPIGLGDATYRSELAAQIAITLVQHQFGNLGPR